MLKAMFATEEILGQRGSSLEGVKIREISLYQP